MNTHEPLISIVIPTYNRLNYLRTSLQSVLAQTYGHFEVIVADDCSPTDPTPVVAAFSDSRLRVRRNVTNLGNGPNVAQAFTLTQGKYVASLNDDDYWHPEFLATLVAPLAANASLSAAFCDHYIVDAKGRVDEAATDENSRRWGRDRLAAGIHRPFIKEALISQAVSPASAALLRREAIAWEELAAVGVYWDHYLAYLSCRDGWGAHYCPQRLTYYRVHEQSETHLSGSKDAAAKIRKGRSGQHCYGTFLKDPNLQDFAPYFRKKWIEASTTLAIGLIKSGQPAAARLHARAALRQGPNLRTAAALALSLLPSGAATRLFASP